MEPISFEISKHQAELWKVIYLCDSLSYIVDKTKFWDAHRGDELNARQIKVLNKLLDIGSENFKGDLTKKKYVKIANTAQTNASRDLADLLEKACIKKVEGTTGRGTKYTINHKTWYF